MLRHNRASLPVRWVCILFGFLRNEDKIRLARVGPVCLRRRTCLLRSHYKIQPIIRLD